MKPQSHTNTRSQIPSQYKSKQQSPPIVTNKPRMDRRKMESDAAAAANALFRTRPPPTPPAPKSQQQPKENTTSSSSINGSSSGSIQSRKRKQNVVNQYVSILDTWFGKNATNNQSTKRFEDVIGLMLDIWSGEKVVEDDIRNNMEKMIRNRNNQNETFIVIVNMLNIFIEKYEHIVQLVDKQKLKTLPGKNTISRMSMDVGLVINDGNLYQKKYRGW